MRKQTNPMLMRIFNKIWFGLFGQVDPLSRFRQILDRLAKVYRQRRESPDTAQSAVFDSGRIINILYVLKEVVVVILKLAKELLGRILILAKTLQIRLGLAGKPKILYVYPHVNWVVDWIGQYLTTRVEARHGQVARHIPKARWQVGQVIHYGSLATFIGNLGRPVNRNNKVVATIYHGNPESPDPDIQRIIPQFIAGAGEADRILTACTIMENRLLSWGCPREQVVKIPLGVDLDVFQPPEPGEKAARRGDLGIPETAFCIGSFQKDGTGWGAGLEPKLVKGPDVFLKVMEKLSLTGTVFVLLTGPSRGYIKKGLDELGIGYHHELLEDHRELAKRYHCLDAYLVSAREEGGPQSVLESLACGVPLVSTRVGMAPDVIDHGRNGLLADVEDVASMVDLLEGIRHNPDSAAPLVAQGLRDIQAYDWDIIADRYYHEVYRDLLVTR